MFSHLVSAVLLTTAATALTLPASSLSKKNSTSGAEATSSNITYYQGGSGTFGSTDTSNCNIAVSKGTIASEFCRSYTVEAIGLPHSSQAHCSFTIWSGSTTCDGDNKKTIDLPKDNGTTCIGTGVLDGGRFQHASGIWSCS